MGTKKTPTQWDAVNDAKKSFMRQSKIVLGIPLNMVFLAHKAKALEYIILILRCISNIRSFLLYHVKIPII